MTEREFVQALEAADFKRPESGYPRGYLTRGDVAVLIVHDHARIAGAEKWKPFEEILADLGGAARLAIVRRLSKAVQDAGLTPFDLCSWPGLLVLTDRASDLDWTARVREELEAAIRRKAEDLDGESGTNFHRAILGEPR